MRTVSRWLDSIRSIGSVDRILAKFRGMEGILVGLVAVGVALRVAALNTWGVVWDGAEYATMGWSFLQHGEFLVPYAETPTYYRHYPPLYPWYLAAWYAAFGFSAGVTQVASLVLSVIFILVAYLITADLLGRGKALYTAAFVALDPPSR